MSIYDPFSFHVLMLIAGHQCENALFFKYTRQTLSMVVINHLVREHMSLKKVPWDFCDDFKRPV